MSLDLNSFCFSWFNKYVRASTIEFPFFVYYVTENRNFPIACTSVVHLWIFLLSKHTMCTIFEKFNLRICLLSAQFRRYVFLFVCPHSFTRRARGYEIFVGWRFCLTMWGIPRFLSIFIFLSTFYDTIICEKMKNMRGKPEIITGTSIRQYNWTWKTNFEWFFTQRWRMWIFIPHYLKIIIGFLKIELLLLWAWKMNINENNFRTYDQSLARQNYE